MPISPIAPIRYDLCETVMAEIDSQIELTRAHSGECGVYRVTVIDKLSKAERDFICQEYLEADWQKALSITSAENGERPGLLMFTLVP